MAVRRDTPEQDLLKILKPEIEARQIVVFANSDQYFRALEEYFPLFGSKIDWSKVFCACEEKINYNQFEMSVLGFFDKAAEALGLHAASAMIFIGDSAMDVALSTTAEIMRRYLIDVVDMPQHTYIVPQDVSWCLSYTMEGNMAYGRRPIRPSLR
jgi:hypothetical protein